MSLDDTFSVSRLRNDVTIEGTAKRRLCDRSNDVINNALRKWILSNWERRFPARESDFKVSVLSVKNAVICNDLVILHSTPVTKMAFRY